MNKTTQWWHILVRLGCIWIWCVCVCVMAGVRMASVQWRLLSVCVWTLRWINQLTKYNTLVALLRIAWYVYGIKLRVYISDDVCEMNIISVYGFAIQTFIYITYHTCSLHYTHTACTVHRLFLLSNHVIYESCVLLFINAIRCLCVCMGGSAFNG